MFNELTLAPLDDRPTGSLQLANSETVSNEAVIEKNKTHLVAGQMENGQVPKGTQFVLESIRGSVTSDRKVSASHEELSLISEETKVSESQCRSGEADKLFFRSDRFYKSDGKFYFSTREGMEVGPYNSRDDAVKGLERFMEGVAANKCPRVARTFALSGNWAFTNFS